MSVITHLRGRITTAASPKANMSPALAEIVAQEDRVEVQLFTDLWGLDRVRLSEHRIRLLADYLAKVRHSRFGESGEEREQEKLDWEEARWILECLRPSLVIDADVNPAALATRLAEMQRRSLPGDTKTTVLIAALDGAPEFRHNCFLKARNNGRQPETQVKKKAGKFYQHCFNALSRYEVLPTDQKGGESFFPGVKTGDDARLFEDAFVGVLKTGPMRVMAIAASIHLHQTLGKYNDENDLPWMDRIYARVSLASSWEAAVKALPLIWRGQTRVGADIWSGLTHEEQELLLSANVRPGERLTN